MPENILINNGQIWDKAYREKYTRVQEEHRRREYKEGTQGDKTSTKDLHKQQTREPTGCLEHTVHRL